MNNLNILVEIAKVFISFPLVGRGHLVNFFSLRNARKLLKSPPGRRGRLVNFFSLRNTCKYMKLLKKIVTPPPALRHS